MNDLKLNQIIWQTVAAIPEGKVATYGQIAKLCGYASYARYVGATLKHLPEDTTLPWHRVINARGELSFAPDSDAYNRQKSLLEQEGVVFKRAKVDLSNYGWDCIP